MTDCHLFGMNPAGHQAVTCSFTNGQCRVAVRVLRWTRGVVVQPLVAALFRSSAERGTGGVGHRPQRRPEHVSGPIISADLFPVHRKGRRPALRAGARFLCHVVDGQTRVVPFLCSLLLLDYWPLKRTGRIASRTGLRAAAVVTAGRGKGFC